MDPLIKSQLLCQLSYAPTDARGAGRGASPGRRECAHIEPILPVRKGRAEAFADHASGGVHSGFSSRKLVTLYLMPDFTGAPRCRWVQNGGNTTIMPARGGTATC